MPTSSYCEPSKVLDLLFEGYEGPSFEIRLWDGWHWCSHSHERPRCNLVINNYKTFKALIVRPSEITLGEAFLQGDIDVTGDIFSVFVMADYLFRRPEGQRQKLLETASRALLNMAQSWNSGIRHSAKRDRAAIAHHYDQPATFYRPWLGESLVYSCAYFQCPEDDLDAAQEHKLDLICRKLRLHPDDHFLDIGCGWGSLILHAASRHNVYAQGITISREQAAVAKARIDSEHLTQSCKVDLLDYRDVPARFAPFNKLASVGMFEHVGLQNLPRYFQTAYRILTPGGVFLNHGIARTTLRQSNDGSFFNKYIEPTLDRLPWIRHAHDSAFMDKYVFPDGELATISEAVSIAEQAGFEVRDVENLREHYELTLRAWVDRLQQNATQILQLVPNVTYRIWLLYMAGCAAAFHRGDIAVYQTLLSRPHRGDSGLPLTRRDWYTAELHAGNARLASGESREAV